MTRLENFFGKNKNRDGICSYCGIKYIRVSPYQKTCKTCMPIRRRAYHRVWHNNQRKKPEVRKLWNKKSAEWRAKNRIKANLNTRDFNRRVKRLCLDKYGKICQCCGESRYEFLAIDHINGGGIKHRKENNIKTVYGWLKKNNFPEGFRVLCHNCNCALGHFGYCPHKDLVRHQDLLNSLVLPKSSPPTAI